MAAAKIPQSRYHTGSFAGDEMQRQAGVVASGANRLVDRVAALEGLSSVLLVLDVAFTTTAATAQPTKLRFPVNRGEEWLVEFWGYGSCSTVTGMKYAIGCPTGSTATGELESSSTNTLVANWTTQTLSANTLSAATHVGATNAARPDRICVRVRVYDDGEIVLQAASASAGDTTTVYALSCLRATKVVLV